jgi:hypothetical protein
MVGRHPEPDDLIVPLPPEAAARRRIVTGDPYRGHGYSGHQWRLEDLPTLGWRHRRHYDMRATFITLALEDGADPHLIETRVTHTRKARSAFDGYNRGRQWELTCAEVAKLKISRRPVGQGEALVLPVTPGGKGTGGAGAAGGTEGGERAACAEESGAAEGAGRTETEASRYGARYSARKIEGSHAKICLMRSCQARRGDAPSRVRSGGLITCSVGLARAWRSCSSRPIGPRSRHVAAGDPPARRRAARWRRRSPRS